MIAISGSGSAPGFGNIDFTGAGYDLWGNDDLEEHCNGEFCFDLYNYGAGEISLGNGRGSKRLVGYGSGSGNGNGNFDCEGRG